MKINSLSGALKFLGRTDQKDVSRDRDPQGQGYSREQGSSGQNQKDKEKGTEQEPLQVTDTQVQTAIEAFGSDVLALANGLQASSEGTGPGLKVLLKDGSGAVIRQFTGEEFLKMRQAAGKDSRQRGKILDQKL